MEPDLAADLGGFLSKNAEVRRRAGDALQRWQRSNASGFASALLARVSSNAGLEERVLASVLLRKTIAQSSEKLLGDGVGDSAWASSGFGDALLEALSTATPDPMLRRHVAEVVAAAASLQFQAGRAWPELALLLARWCKASGTERAVVLHVLEELSDEADVIEADVPDENMTSCVNGFTSAYTLLPFLEDHAGALHSLLSAALVDEADKTSRDAAARIYALCASGRGVPAPLQASVVDLAPVLAEAVIAQGRAQDTARHQAQPRSEACFHAVALAVRADPAAWAFAGSTDLAQVLEGVAVDSMVEVSSRSAAFAALVELATMPQVYVETAPDATSRAVSVLIRVLVEFPGDEETDEWAEDLTSDDVINVVQLGDEAPDAAADGFHEAALDAAGRLACSNGEAFLQLRTEVGELLTRQVWQARHGGLLVLLRLACASEVAASIEIATCAASVAAENFCNVHPRVRWAALEVWARLLASGFSLPNDLSSSLNTILSLIAGDLYARVQRRGLFVLVLLTTCDHVSITSSDAESIYRRVLLPLVASPDPVLRAASTRISNGLSAALSLEDADSDQGAKAGLLALRSEFDGIARGVAGMATGLADEEPVVDIDWPADWQ